MNAAQETELRTDIKVLLQKAAATEQHLKTINGALTDAVLSYRKQVPACSIERGKLHERMDKLWTAIWGNRIAIVIIALTGGGAATKLFHLW